MKKCEECYFKQNYNLKLFIPFKIDFSCCFSLGGNLNFPDFPPKNKSFKNINYRTSQLVNMISAKCDQIWRFLDFGQLFKAFGNNKFAQISQHSKATFVNVLKSIIFVVKSFLGHFYRHLAIFIWSHCFCPFLYHILRENDLL